MAFETGKNLSGVGAILLFASVPVFFVPYVSVFGAGILALIGIILLLLGVYNLARYYADAGIFNNMLYGSIIAIVGSVATVFISAIAIVAVLPDFLNKIYPGWNGDLASLQNRTPDTSNLTLSDFAPFLQVFLAILVVLFIITLVVALFYRKSLGALSQRSGVGLFGATGTVFLVGAVLSIILVGYLIVWIAALLLAIAFFQLKPLPPPQPSAQQYTAPSAPPPL